MKKKIPYGKQSISKKEANLVSKILLNEKITTGNEVINFENKVRKYLNVKYAASCNSGTSALYLAMHAINIKKNDIIIMPSINFISSYTIAKLFGAKVYLADVNKNTGQMTSEKVNECVKKFKLKSVKCIVVMYNGGCPVDAEKFHKLKKKLRCFIIEDACHAFGSKYKYKNKFIKMGSCLHSDICTFSFHPLKTITTGEGGMVTTNSKKIYDIIKVSRSLGMIRNKLPWDYDVYYKGLNFRLTDFQSYLGSLQLKRIDLFLKKRKTLANRYRNELSKIKNISLPHYDAKYISSNHLFLINLKNSSSSKKVRFMQYMHKNNIIVQYHYIPIYKFKIFRDKYINKDAELYYKSTISLPMYFDLSLKQQKYVIKKIKIFFKH
jgi:dTDP-4-amino-4,6-dideoxygalactose transaminase